MDDVLVWPLSAALIASPNWAIACWFRCSGVVATGDLFACNVTSGGSSATRLRFGRIADDLYAQVYTNDSSARRARTPGALLVDNTWQFGGMEYRGAETAEADECKLLIDAAAVPAVVFSNGVGTPNDMPDTLIQPTGNAFLGANTAAGGQPWVGDIGSHIYVYDPTLVTLEQLTNLMHHQMPVG